MISSRLSAISVGGKAAGSERLIAANYVIFGRWKDEQMADSDHHESTAFVRDGFIVLDRFLDEGEIEEIQTAVNALIVSGPDSMCTRPHNTLLPLRWNDRIVQLCLASERRTQVLTEALGAADLKWISGYVSIKDTGSPALWWHQDWWCWDHAISYRGKAPQVAVLCYLTATDRYNGALRVLPGSHHKSSRIHAFLPEAHADAANGLEPGHIAMIDHPDQVTFCLSGKPGFFPALTEFKGICPSIGCRRRSLK